MKPTRRLPRIAQPQPRLLLALTLTLLGLSLGLTFTQAAAPRPAAPPQPLYETRADHDPDGIGKFYMGREIAHVMGHQAADWLERPTRIEEEAPDKMIDALGLKPGDVVADIGAGTGYHCRRMSAKVGPKGRVHGVDIQPEMLELMDREMKSRGITNVIGTLGTITDPKLPEASIDLALMVDVYHEFSHPYEMTAAICKALKPGGRIAFVEFRGENERVPIKKVHKMTEAQIRKEMTVQPLEWVETISTLPWQHLVIFRKTATSK